MIVKPKLYSDKEFGGYMENPGIEPGNYQFFTLSIELFK
jgi:hypothetical protein